jgi:hypothetical protein
LKKLVRKILKRIRNRPIRNFYKKEFSKRVLLCYVTIPFKKSSFSHTAYIEVKTLAKVFDELGYIVDVIDYEIDSQKSFIYKTSYDIIFGFGTAYNNAILHKNNSKAIKIAYATGAHNSFQNNAELNRIKYLYERRGVLLRPKRIIDKAWSVYSNISDAVLLIGNSRFTKKTFDTYTDVTVLPINIPIFTGFSFKDTERKYIYAKKNFLWFGSSGLVHKGLDLCIDVFTELKEYHLHICCPKEDDFFELYSEELFNTENIHYHGFIDISTDSFKEIVSKCAFTIFPSCSEGMSGSLITSMSTGLLPIATLEAGVDLDEDYSFQVESTIDSIKNRVIEVSEIDDNILSEKSKLLLEYVNTNFNENNFYKSVKNNLKKIIKEKK